MATATLQNPVVQPPTEEDVEDICEDLNLGIGEEKQEEYLEWVGKALYACDAIQDVEEERFPVLYPRIPGTKPPKKVNKHNAWASNVVIRGEPTGLLAGKKIAVKDNIFIAGTPLSNGSKIWDGYTPEFDATVVTRILQAGATILGKSTWHHQNLGDNTFVKPHDVEHHDKDTEAAAGYSCSNAVLVVSGEVDMALGDARGGCVACVELKPTQGLVPVTGSIGLMPLLDHISPMAMNVSDVALLLEVIAGYSGVDHRQKAGVVVPSYKSLLVGDLSGKKIGYVTEGFINCSREVKSMLNEYIDKIEEAGAIVKETDIPLHTKSGALYQVLLAGSQIGLLRNPTQAAGYREFYQVSAERHFSRAVQAQAYNMHPNLKAAAMFGEHMRRKDGGETVARAMNKVHALRCAYDEALDNCDVLIMSTSTISTTESIEPSRMYTATTEAFCMTGHPVLSIKLGSVLQKNRRQSVGLMIIGKHFEEVKVLDIAYGIEQLLLQ